MVNPAEAGIEEAAADLGIEMIEGFAKTPRPKGLQADVDEFMKDPKAYGIMRGLTPRGLRNLIIVPTRTQERIADGSFVDKFVDILRPIDFSQQYSGKLGYKDVVRRERAKNPAQPLSRRQRHSAYLRQLDRVL